MQEKRLRLYTQLGNGSSSILYVIAKERDWQNIIIGCLSMKIGFNIFENLARKVNENVGVLFLSSSICR